MNYSKIRQFLFKRNTAIFKENGWNFKIYPDPYRKIKTTLNLEISSFPEFSSNAINNPRKKEKVFTSIVIENSVFISWRFPIKSLWLF